MHTGTVRKRAAAAAALFCCALLSACVKTGTPQARTGFAMGSLVSVSVYAQGDAAGAAAEAALTAVNETDRMLSATLPDAEIYRLNETGEAALSAGTGALLRETKSLCVSLDERLDITLGAVTALWGFSGETPRLPAEKELRAALKTKGLEGLTLQGETAFLKEGMRLDLGAVGKGAGCDAALEALRAYKTPAVLSLGGTVLLYGQKPGGSWSVGVRDPFGNANEYFATLALQTGADGACFVSTSGSYEKCFTENGETYHHILDPETGYPVKTPLLAVTAVGERGLVSDALSTALFVNGLNETSLSWVEEYLTGAVFIFEDGRVYVTEGLRNAFTLLNTNRFETVTDYDKTP